MTVMGSYCKAYYVKDLARFEPWRAATMQVQKQVEPEADGDTERSGESSRPLQDDDYLFLQENFIVTDGIFLDEHVVFDRVTPEWEEFCRRELGFAPELHVDAACSDNAGAGDAARPGASE